MAISDVATAPAGPPAAVRRQRRRVSHTVTFSRQADAVLTQRMEDRGQTRNAVIEAMLWDCQERGGRRLTADDQNAAVGQANAIRLLVRQLRLDLRNPDHLRAVADIDAACVRIGDLVRGGPVPR